MNALFDSGWDLQHPEKLHPNPFHPEPYTREEVDCEWRIVEDLAREAMNPDDSEALRNVKVRMWFQGKWLLWDLGEDEFMKDYEGTRDVESALNESRKSLFDFEANIRASSSAYYKSKLDQTDKVLMLAIEAARKV